MAFLDFLRNRKQQIVSQKPQPERSENARDYFRREAERDKANLKPIESLPPDQKAELDAVRATLKRATAHLEKGSSRMPMPPDVAGTQEAMRQGMTGQEKVAPEMSPTSAQRGVRDGELNRPAADDKPQVQPSKTPQPPRAQTLPRPRPSWQR